MDVSNFVFITTVYCLRLRLSSTYISENGFRHFTPFEFIMFRRKIYYWKWAASCQALYLLNHYFELFAPTHLPIAGKSRLKLVLTMERTNQWVLTLHVLICVPCWRNQIRQAYSCKQCNEEGMHFAERFTMTFWLGSTCFVRTLVLAYSAGFAHYCYRTPVDKRVHDMCHDWFLHVSWLWWI